MTASYRITIRTSQETADAFRDLAYLEAATLGEMLNELVTLWEHKVNDQELCSKLIALKYGNA